MSEFTPAWRSSSQSQRMTTLSCVHPLMNAGTKIADVSSLMSVWPVLSQQHPFLFKQGHALVLAIWDETETLAIQSISQPFISKKGRRTMHSILSPLRKLFPVLLVLFLTLISACADSPHPSQLKIVATMARYTNTSARIAVGGTVR